MDKPALHHAIVSEPYKALETLELLKIWNETGDIKLDPPRRLS